ncbi:MAG: 6-phosphofructokinase [Endomicrobiales bacterium]|jgi:6-phosphofructokinase 1
MKRKKIQRIGVITSGGDAPGMNAAVRAVVRQAVHHGLEVIGIHRGFKGLLEDQYSRLTTRSVSGIINRGGTMLKTGRCPALKTAAGMNRAIGVLRQLKIDGLVVIGGDGSLQAGAAISKHGIPVISIPASIDNDINGTDETIGFDTALDTAVEAIDKIRDTAVSHERVFIVEVMGREHGFLALSIGIASGAEFILVPEIKQDAAALCRELKNEYRRGKTSVIIVLAEGAGSPYELADKIKQNTHLEVRISTLGYIQRGGTPSARSRILACQFGAYAVDLLVAGSKNRLVVIKKGIITDIPVSMAVKKQKPFDHALYTTARYLSM